MKFDVPTGNTDSMSDWSSLAVAVVGVGGTLGGSIVAAVLSNRSAMAARRFDAEREIKALQDERGHIRANEEIEERRIIYTELNATARHYRSALTECLTDAQKRVSDADHLLDLERARREFAECHSRTQMRISAKILQKTDEVGYALGDAYRALMGEYELPGNSTSTEFHACIVDIPSKITNEMRLAMRIELGLASDGVESD
ncbi:hypothetical protein [Actinospica robiniae]|uniref:hypothetical protein n=1 Tax=Actinospica robiniae TaxID=304901 RepID=UPI0012FA5C80|nr:hypothetical protein [Actinospica robiniae]